MRQITEAQAISSLKRRLEEAAGTSTSTLSLSDQDAATIRANADTIVERALAEVWETVKDLTTKQLKRILRYLDIIMLRFGSVKEGVGDSVVGWAKKADSKVRGFFDHFFYWMGVLLKATYAALPVIVAAPKVYANPLLLLDPTFMGGIAIFAFLLIMFAKGFEKLIRLLISDRERPSYVRRMPGET